MSFLMLEELHSWSTSWTATAVVLFTLTTVTLSARVFVRACMLRSFGVDDWLLLTTFIVYIPLATGLLLGGLYMSSTESIVKNLPNLGKTRIIGEAFYLLSQIFLKLALGASFLRIVVRPWQRWTIKLSVSIFVLFEFAYLFFNLFKCGRPKWENLFIQAHCLPRSTREPMDYIAAVLNCITDWILALFPLLLVRTLQITLRAKISVCLIALLGLAGSVVSVVRIPMINGLQDIGDPGYVKATAGLALCSAIESGIGIIALSLAALRPLFVRVLDKTTRLIGSKGAYPVSTVGVRELMSDRTAITVTGSVKAFERDGHVEVGDEKGLGGKGDFEMQIEHDDAFD